MVKRLRRPQASEAREVCRRHSSVLCNLIAVFASKVTTCGPPGLSVKTSSRFSCPMLLRLETPPHRFCAL